MIKKINKQKKAKYLIIALLLYIFLQIISRIFFAFLDYDESYNLQISQHFRQNIFNYATYSDKFDPNITTGPTVLIPAAILINNTFPLLPRLIALVYVSIFISFTLYFIYKNNLQRLIFLITLAFTPLFYFFSAHIVGEIPGFVLLLISLYLIPKKKFLLIGLFFYLSLLTKSIYLFGLPSLIYLFFYTTRSYNRLFIVNSVKQIYQGFFLGLFAWLGYMFLASNLNINNLLQYLYVMIKTNNYLSKPKLTLFFDRIHMLNYVFMVDGFLLLLLFFIIFITVFLNRKNPQLIKSISLFGICYGLYSILLGPTDLYRHFLPVLLALAVIIPFFINNIKLLNKKLQYSILIFICLIFVNFIFNITSNTRFVKEQKRNSINLIFNHEGYFPITAPDPILLDQIKTAEYIKNNISENSTISGVDWWNYPEIQYLSNRAIIRNPSEAKYLITSKDLISTFKKYKYVSKLLNNNKTIYKNGYYEIYSLDKN